MRLVLLFFFFYTSTASAHNGASTPVYPVAGIAVDGRGEDWSPDITWQPIERVASGRPADDDADLRARFKAGYDASAQVLYLLVEVVDQSVVIDSVDGPNWYAQDGCEIYIDAAHDSTSGMHDRYAIMGPHHLAYLRSGGVVLLEKRPEVSVVKKREEDTTYYEWRIALSDSLQAGRVLALDVAVFDRDEDGSASWLAWGGGVYEDGSRGWLGDILLATEIEDLATVHGSVTWSGRDQLWRHGRVRAQAIDSDFYLESDADAHGKYSMQLPAGAYRIAPSIGAVSPEGQLVRARGGLSHRADLSLSLSQGRTQKVGPGWRQLSHGGARKGAWQNFTVAHGLPYRVIAAILQDRRGDLWMGSLGGITRYDGREMRTFTEADGLVGGRVFALAEDAQGHIWIGAEKGLCRYDGSSFTTYTTADGMSNNNVRALAVDGEDGLWVGTWGSGLLHYADGVFTAYDSRSGLACNRINDLAVALDGTVWISYQGGGVSAYREGAFRHFSQADGLAADFVNDIALAEDAVFFATEMNGVSRYDGARFQTFNEQNSTVANNAASVWVDVAGDVWVGNILAGVARYDGASWDRYTVADGLLFNRVFCVVGDREGSVWVGTKWGVSRFSGANMHTYKKKNGLADITVHSLGAGVAEQLWVGTETGASLVEMGRVKANFTPEDGLGVGRGGYRVMATAVDHHGAQWFGTEGGLVRYAQGDFSIYSMEDGLAFDEVWALAVDGDGYVWAGTDGGGVSRYDGKHFKNFTTEDGLAHERVWSLLADSQGRVWLGTAQGLSVFATGQIRTFGEVDGLPPHAIRALFEDAKGDIWIGTEYGGALRYDGESFVHYGVEDGLGGHTVLAFAADTKGHMWFGTQGGGVSIYDGQVFQTLLDEDGIAHNVVSALYCDKEGAMWLGTGGGISRYRHATSDPHIEIRSVVDDRRRGSASALFELGGAHFEFVGHSLKTRKEQLVYRYRLQGYDKEWQSTRAEQVGYTDLPVGVYVFEVVAIDRDLNYSTQPARARIEIKPPYVAILLVGGCGLLLVVAAMTSVRAVQSRREAFVATRERNAALEQANAQLREADRLKSDFVSNVSHELRTPLTVIRGSIDNMLDGITGSFNERQGLYLNRLKVHADRLALLIDDLLDLSRIEAGHLEVEKVRASVADIARDVVDHLQPLAEQEKLEVELRNVEGDTEALIDPNRVYQVLLNLVNNAIKFTPQGGRVTVVVKCIAGEVEVAVEDTGPGIVADELGKIFEKFHQIGQSNESYRGAGIGLSIARRLVEMHGGQIRAESEPGVGSRFIFVIPKSI